MRVNLFFRIAKLLMSRQFIVHDMACQSGGRPQFEGSQRRRQHETDVDIEMVEEGEYMR